MAPMPQITPPAADPSSRGAADPIDLVVIAERALVGDHLQAAAVHVSGSRIAGVWPADGPVPAGASVLRLAADEVLLPGLVDTHVHINEPGRTEWEGFASATRAAVAGGITTVLDMPLNSIPPTTTVRALELKRAAAQGQIATDVGFLGGVVPGNTAELAGLVAAGVFGFKCFLPPSGVDEFPAVDPGQLGEALAEIGRLDSLLMVHAEDPEVLAEAPQPRGRQYRGFLDSRPAAAEAAGVATVAAAAAGTGARAHIVHLSSAAGVAAVRDAQRAGIHLTAETCPHYLTLEPGEIPDGATEYKCCPPIRGGADADALWQGLADGVISALVSDHSPCPPAMKSLETGDFGDAWGGISSVQVGLPVVWSAARRRGVPLAEVVRWMSAAPADLAGIRGKGRIAAGHDADLMVFAPDATRELDPAALRHRHHLTPYNGRTLFGAVRTVLLRGRSVTEQADGLLLERSAR
jgi:allantoinase